MVESPEPDPNNLQNRDPRSDDKPEHTNGHSREDGRCSRPVAENYQEIIMFVDGTLRSKAWR
jgi:hypothetical protein